MIKAIEVQAPNEVNAPKGYNKIFLAGSIEMGKAENWQEKVVRALKDEEVVLTNPRRDDWDPTWEQTIENKKFNEQVTWELTNLDDANIIILYLDPNTKSPISLLELGLYATSKRLMVCCPEGFWRKGNVDIVCEKYDIPMFETIEDLTSEIKKIMFRIKGVYGKK